MRGNADYYYKRAEAELEMAQRSDVPEAVRAHYTLAGYYLDYVYAEADATRSELARIIGRASNT